MRSTTWTLVTRTLALLLPAMVLAGGYLWLLAAEERALSERAAAMEAELAALDPEVVFVGNSLVRAGVDPRIVGQGLGDRPVRVANAAEPGTRPANWYTVLKNRVYGQGLRPKLVVVGMIPSTMVRTGVSNDLAQRSLANHAADYEPVVDRKVYGRDAVNPMVHRLHRNRGAFQDAWARTVRALSVGLFMVDGDGGVLERGERIASASLEAVFGLDGALDMSLHHRVIPIALPVSEARAASDRGTVADSFVPDLLDLAEAHGSRVAFAWFPLTAAKTEAVALDPAEQAALVTLLNEGGAAWIDLHARPFGDELFTDAVHLNQAGRERLSRLLAQELSAIDALGSGPFAPAEVPVTASFVARLEGTPPDLGPVEPEPSGKDDCLLVIKRPDLFALSNTATDAAGVGMVSPIVVLEDGRPLTRRRWKKQLEEPRCSGAYLPQTGRMWLAPSEPSTAAQHEYTLALSANLPVSDGTSEGWWVYPGTSLELDLDLQGGAQPTALVLGLEPILDKGPSLEATVDGVPMILEPVGPAWYRARLPLVAGTSPDKLLVRSPADGPYALLRWVAVETERGTADLIGDASRMEPPLANLIPKAGPSPVEALTEAATFPLELAAADAPKVAKAAIPALVALDDTAISARLPCRGCSPLRLVENGTERDAPAWVCSAVRKGEPDQSCQDEDSFLFTAGDGSDPLANGKPYALRLRDERRYKERVWIYPGDRLRIAARITERRRLRHGASSLTIGAVPIADTPDGRLSLRLLGGEDVYLETTLPLRVLAEGSLEIPLDRRLPATGGAVTLELTSDAQASYLLLEQALLRQ